VESGTSNIPVLFCHVPFPGQPFILGEMTEFFVQLVGEMVDHSEEFLHPNLVRLSVGGHEEQWNEIP